MKKIAVCVFSVILFLLIFCTALAPCVEREMQTLVEIHHIYEQLKMYNHNIPTRAVQWPEGLMLYHVVEGKGWNTGSRIEEVPKMSYYITEEVNMITGEVMWLSTEVYPGKKFEIVLSASRQPAVGDKISVVEEFKEREDVYIFYYPQGAENLNGFTNFFQKTAESQQAMVVIPKKAEAPFLEHSILYSLREMKAETLRVFSVEDIKQFYGMLPLVFILAGILLLGLFLWVYSCILAKKGERRGAIWRNAGIGAGLLCFVPWITWQIDLPASLMPKSNILDFGHYRSEFRQIFNALTSVGSDMFRQEQIRALWWCIGVLAVAMLLMSALLLLDRRKKTK